MALNSQGVVIRRESTAVGSTGVQTAADMAFVVAGNTITSPSGFANLSTGMRVKTNSPANTGAYTIKTTAATAITVYETVSVEASGTSRTLTGHVMQAIGEVVSFNGPGITANVIDVTSLQSTAKEKQVGLQDPGQVSLSVLLNVETSVEVHTKLKDDMEARTLRQFDIIFTEPTTHKGAVYFGGYVSGFGITGAVDNVVRADITITLSSGCDFIQPAAS